MFSRPSNITAPLPWGWACAFLAAVFAILVGCPTSYAENAHDSNALQKALNDGNAAFDSGDFQAAVRAYEKAVALGDRSPTLFLVLGNAHFRSGSPGKAALYWRRAQITSPLQAESRQNLKFLTSKSTLLSFENDSIDYVTGLLPLNLWMIAGTIGFWLFVLGGVSLTLGPARKSLRRAGSLSCWLGLLIAILCLSVYSVKKYRNSRIIANLGIVTDSTIARTSASEESKSVIELEEGSEVAILGSRGPWTYVGIPGDLRGWVRTQTTAPLWPFEEEFIQ